jgi:DNA-binding response OmpR family regulator
VKALSVLIISDEPIFSFGLRVQFQKWGFSGVEVSLTCEQGLQYLLNQMPSLVIMDEKFLKQPLCGELEFIADMMTVPIVLFGAKQKHLWHTDASRQIKYSHTYLSKPCHITDLQAVVENLLRVNIAEV